MRDPQMHDHTPSPALTVVIPTRQRQHLLAQLLTALDRQTVPPDQYDVIVVVDGSTDGTCAMLASCTPPYALTWRWQPNAGRASACNAGIALARGGLVVLLDDDMEPRPGFLQAHAAEHPPGSRLAVMGAAPILVPPGSTGVVEYVGRKFNRHLETLARRGHAFPLRSFYSGNLSIRRDLLTGVGGFDEDFTMYGNEDLELAWRLRAAGIQIVFSPAAMARQHYVKDFQSLARDNVSKGRTAVLLATKHPAAASELKLASLARASPRRLVLGALVMASRVWPATADRVVTLMSALGRLRLPLRAHAYALALDYFFLLGVTTADDMRTGTTPAAR